MSANIFAWIFDPLIAEILIVSAILFYIIRRDAFIKKNSRLAKWPVFSALCLAGLAAVFLTVAYGSFIEPQIIKINRQDIYLSNEAKPIKIALISDFHAGVNKKGSFFNRAYGLVEKENPDLVLIAGDVVDISADQTKYLGAIGDLGKKFRTFAVLGNHDAGDGTGYDNFSLNPEKIRQIINYLKNQNIKVLENIGEKITIAGREIYLGGIKDCYTNKEDVAAAFAGAPKSDVLNPLKGAPKDIPRILLAHEPDIIYEAEKNQIDLTLAAHTHGGQIRLPFYGMVSEPFTELGRYFDKGLFRFGNTQLFITSGLGETGARARLFNPPEIVILNIY